MKKIILVGLLCLLIALSYVDIPSASATNEEDLHVTPGLSQDISREPMPSNFTTDDYLDTIYSNTSPQSFEEEGDNPLYVLVFGDEEERPIGRSPSGDSPVLPWDDWASLQLERGDAALAANFGIDIRILGFEEWDSDDSLDNIYDLWYELESDTEQYLRQWYSGEWWSNYVDAIIGITSQVDPYPVAGLSSGPELLDQGRIFTLLNWQVYWADDNLVQHEVSHLYFNDVPCSYTSYHWCIDCHGVIQGNSDRYPIRTLTISASSGGTTTPDPGICAYGYGSSVSVTASAYSGYTFNYWILDGATNYGNPITVTMNSDHTLKAYFYYSGGGGGGGGCPTLFVWNGADYVEEGFLNIHAESDVTVQQEIQNTLALENDVYKLQLRELDEYTSHIDQVRLYAVDDEGEWHSCPITYAYHNELGKVKHTLRFDDDNRVDLKPTEIIDLKFGQPIPYSETEYFIFEINGYNVKMMW